LRSDKAQGSHLAEVTGCHIVASIDHINAFIGMSFQQLYQECREAFLVNSDLTLQAQLVEFRDHRLIQARKKYEGF